MDTSEFLATVEHEGTDPFANIVPTQSDSPAENVEEEVKPEVGETVTEATVNTPDEDNLPFHKHPRWIEREQELKELRERDAEKERVIEELSRSTYEVQDKLSKFDVVDTDIPEWFIELYGENETAWIKYQQHDNARREDLKREILEEQATLQRQSIEEEKYWQNWTSQKVGELKGKGYEFDQNELMKTILEWKPTDDQGNLDFEKGYQIMQMNKRSTVDPIKSQARKQVADTATKTSGNATQVKDYMTPSDLRHKSWNQL